MILTFFALFFSKIFAFSALNNRPILTVPRSNGDFDSLDCIYFANFSYYHFTSPIFQEKAYQVPSSTFEGQQFNASFNMCERLEFTTLKHCSGPYYASVGLNDSLGQQSCQLNATEFTVKSVQINDTMFPAFFYYNSEALTPSFNVSELQINMICDMYAASKQTIGEPEFNYTDNGIKITSSLTSFQSCPVFTYNAVFQYVARYKFFWALNMSFVGVLMGFYGVRYRKASFFILTTLSCAVGLAAILFASVLANVTIADSWIVITFAIIAGFLGSFLS